MTEESGSDVKEVAAAWSFCYYIFSNTCLIKLYNVAENFSQTSESSSIFIQAVIEYQVQVLQFLF